MAALIEAIAVKHKMFFEHDGAPYLCLDADVSTPTAPFMVLTLDRSGDRVTGTLSHPERRSTDGLTFSGIGGEVVTERMTGRSATRLP